MRTSTPLSRASGKVAQRGARNTDFQFQGLEQTHHTGQRHGIVTWVRRRKGMTGGKGKLGFIVGRVGRCGALGIPRLSCIIRSSGRYDQEAGRNTENRQSVASPAWQPGPSRVLHDAPQCRFAPCFFCFLDLMLSVFVFPRGCRPQGVPPKN